MLYWRRICWGPTMAVIAKNVQIYKLMLQTLAKKEKEWNSSDLSELPIYEPGLEKLLKIAEVKIFIFQPNKEAN